MEVINSGMKKKEWGKIRLEHIAYREPNKMFIEGIRLQQESIFNKKMTLGEIIINKQQIPELIKKLNEMQQNVW